MEKKEKNQWEKWGRKEGQEEGKEGGKVEDMLRELRVDYGQASIVKSNMSMSLSYLEDEISKINSAINDIESLNRSYGKTSTILNELYDQKKKAQQSYDEMQEFNEKFSKFISNVKTTDTELAKKFTSDIKTYCKKNF